MRIEGVGSNTFISIRTTPFHRVSFVLTFYLVRHGQTHGNIDHLVIGCADSPLTTQGIGDAKSVGRNLRLVKFDHVYSSDLPRAVTTAQIIMEQLPTPRPQLSLAKELRELDVGKYTLLRQADAAEEFASYKQNINVPIPGGESYTQLQARLVVFINRIEEARPNATVLFVSHSEAIRVAIPYYKGLKLDTYLNDDLSHRYIGRFVIDSGKLVQYEELSCDCA
jgi:probable phosphoglycerate mutase